MKGLENFCTYVDIEGKIFALLVTTPDTPSISQKFKFKIESFLKRLSLFLSLLENIMCS